MLVCEEMEKFLELQKGIVLKSTRKKYRKKRKCMSAGTTRLESALVALSPAVLSICVKSHGTSV